ncbi:MAG: thymidine phosphorylase [Planctomycetota bacterium]|nr:MAG: thymidine phosphorylase [Planctomycetota bacterium]
MNPVWIIQKKRDRGELTAAEIGEFIAGYVRGDVPDYQMSALAMAIYLNGMTTDETAALTDSMLNSGARFEWPDDGRLRADKHSTGGIGDKTSLLLAPMLACCGLQVPMISGRGLGATGGTLDKLEAIPGFRTDLSMEEVRDVVRRVGCVITGATADLVPADRKLYALRDVTATVPSIPLITASIMSKKLAEGLDALVLDVKFGSGAFMKTLDQARRLAESLVSTGKRMGVATTALLTDMNQPLGRMAGNAVEVNESVAALEGRGPADLMEVTLALGAQVLAFAGRRPGRSQDGGREGTGGPPRCVASRGAGCGSSISAFRLPRGHKHRKAGPGDHRHAGRTAAARRPAGPLHRH